MVSQFFPPPFLQAMINKSELPQTPRRAQVYVLPRNLKTIKVPGEKKVELVKGGLW